MTEEEAPSTSVAPDAENFTVKALREQAKKEAESMPAKEKSSAADRKYAASREKAMAEAAKVSAKAREKTEKDQSEVRRKENFNKINKYLERFPFLRSKFPPLNPRASETESAEMLRLIRETMDSSRSVPSLIGWFNTGFSILENAWGDGKSMTMVPEPLRLNLTGLSQLFREGKFTQLDPLILEIDVEYPWIGRRPLVARLLETVKDILLSVHMFNTNPAARRIFEMGKSPAVPISTQDADDL
jgi:hypothetical protein